VVKLKRFLVGIPNFFFHDLADSVFDYGFLPLVSRPWFSVRLRIMVNAQKVDPGERPQCRKGGNSEGEEYNKKYENIPK